MSKRANILTTFLWFSLLAIAGGCSKGPDRQKTEAFFVDWLKAHGETNIVVDGAGVGIAGNATRLRASLYGLKKEQDGNYTAEMEFRIRLPANGGEIVEYVIGIGKTEEDAIKDSELNFVLTTFHVVYRGFINAGDPHQKVHQVTVNGTPREMMMGDIYVRGGDAKKPFDFEELRTNIRTAICNLPLSAHPHWVKIVSGQAPGKPLMLSAALDNTEHEALGAALKSLKWPAPDQGYMMKEFIVVK